ncbi:hypothetical protein DYD21_08925 [Rhodohalobacter sp. SW132]|uniref:hypothetical protein n=1 Tax=Rhodohalobacter sp. SW132 TaxID=2293433 RepID=UPI000E36FD2B|nr:hypothetical protein [Rhodohalobacter sp. SW132]REL37892.1 hypothetical protein DYD21_08925 [Rhodohalobacter sp. SW132]
MEKDIKKEFLNDTTSSKIPSDRSEEFITPGKNSSYDDYIDVKFRRLSQWASVGGTGIASIFFFSFLVWHVLNPGPANGWLVRIIQDQYAATVGVPLSAITAFCIVTVLNVINKGDIEFSFLGLTFKGASGPVILWVICFLALILGFSVLWEN